MARLSAEAEAEARRRSQIRMAIWAAVAVVVVIIFIILAKLVSNAPGNSSDNSGATAAPAPLLQKVTSLDPKVFAAVGQGTANPLPKAIGAPVLTDGGKPRVLYIGAEYCPFCAAERWAMVIALSRFGSFANLKVTHSSATDTYPNTPTFSFHGASYTSNYLAFTGVETSSNQIQGTKYAPLDSPSAADEKLLQTYDAPPYVDASAAGSIPFIDFGGQLLISGSTYSPQVLQGKSADQIADALSDPNSDISKGAVGSANAITAALCKLTNDQPGNVCKTSVIQDLKQKIGG